MSATRIRIENRTKSEIIDSEVTIMDSEGWEGNDRPNLNLSRIRIPSRQILEKSEVISGKASSYFILKLRFKDGKKDKIGIDQKYALGDEVGGFCHPKNDHWITYHKFGDNILGIVIHN